MSLVMAFRLGGFGELPGVDFGLSEDGVPFRLKVGLTLSPALKDLDLGLPLDKESEPLTERCLKLDDMVHYK